MNEGPDDARDAVRSGRSLDDDVLELYIIERLPESDLAAVEEHLLVCEACRCRSQETCEFIHAMKAALTDSHRRRNKKFADSRQRKNSGVSHYDMER